LKQSGVAAVMWTFTGAAYRTHVIGSESSIYRFASPGFRPTSSILNTQWLWSRIRDRTNDCLWSLQPIRKAYTVSVQLPG